jgi:hypothetical protein
MAQDRYRDPPSVLEQATGSIDMARAALDQLNSLLPVGEPIGGQVGELPGHPWADGEEP